MPNESEERQARLRALGAKAGGALPRASGAVLTTTTASIQQHSADIEIPALTKLMGKIGGFLTGGGQDIEKKLLETNKDQSKELEDQSEDLDAIKENTEATADAVGEQLDLFEEQKRAATEAKRESSSQVTSDGDDDTTGEAEKSGGFFSTIIQFLMKALPILATLASVLLTDFEKLGEKFRTMYDDTIKPVITKIGTKFSTMMDETIKPAIAGIGSKFKSVIDDTVKPAMSGILTALKDKFPGLSKFLDAAVDTGKAVGENITSKVTPAVKALTQGVTQAAPKVKGNALTRLVSSVSDVVSGGAKAAGGLLGKGALKVVKKIPVIGPAIEAYFLSGKYDKLSAARDNGVITEEEYKKAMIVEVVSALGSLLGGTAGVVAGGGVASVATGVGGALAGDAAARYGAEQFLGVDSSDIFARVDAASGGSTGGDVTVINNNNVDASTANIESGSGEAGAPMIPSTGSDGSYAAAH
jgi:hypothetical protein